MWLPAQLGAARAERVLQWLGAEEMVDAGELDPDDVGRFVETAHRAAREGRFAMSLTMHAVVGTRP